MSKNYNSTDLKACIADAKAVRESAIENAKAVLLEEFNSGMSKVLADKLKNEAAEEDELDVTATETPTEDGGEKVDVDATATEETAPAEPVNVTVTDDQGQEVPVATVNDQPVEPAPEGETAPEDDANAPEVDGDETGEEAAEDPEQFTESDIDAVLKELAGDTALAEEKTEDEGQETVKVQPTGLDDASTVTVDVKDDSKKDDLSFPVNEEVSLEEMLAELDSQINEAKEDDKKEDETEEECADKAECKDVKAEEIAEALMIAHKQNTELRKELEQYKNALNEMNSYISEVKLLNAKLLYTNKLFRNKGLTESQKKHIIQAFDRAKTEREVKLSYVLLHEELNPVAVAVKKPLTKKLNTTVSSITEGLASKPVASTRPSKEVLNEAEIKVQNRLQRLAGIDLLNQ